MRLDSRESPVYLPEADQSSVLRLGIQPLDLRQWVLPAMDLLVFRQHKCEVRETHSDRVYQALPGSEPAQRELHQRLLQHLVQDHDYQCRDNVLRHEASGLCWKLSEPDLWTASCWVQEDLCILERRNGEYQLTAASVCSPSNWKLEEKIGGNLNFIHDPVPGYHEVLASRVNRLFDGLRPDKPLLRFNWSIQPGNELFWRRDLGIVGDGAQRYWRVERQTLTRLPQTGAIVFGIRISLHGLAIMDQLDGFTSSLADILQRLPPQQKQYKGLA